MPHSTSGLASQISGWGIDLDPGRRPGIPREKDPQTNKGSAPEDSTLVKQVPRVKIHRTIERTELTPTFGTSCPPKGLSGQLRTVAYRYGEGRLMRWLTLLLADRVDVLESVFSDIVRGRAGNPLSQMGLKAELRHNPRRLRRTVLLFLAGAVVGGR